MKAVYENCALLDQRAVDLGLDELILMENAGFHLANFTQKALKKRGLKGAKILIVLGAGNNAADALVAARNLKNVNLFCVDNLLESKFKKSPLFEKHYQIAKNLHLNFLEKKPNLNEFDAIIEAIFGAGSRALQGEIAEFVEELNETKAFKIACDLPCGLGFGVHFKAHLCVCMGALKELLLEDFAKQSVGKIKLANLGLSREKYASSPKAFLLEKKDLKLIKREKSSNKGSFGHGFIYANASAGSLCALAALNFGAGLVSLIAEKAFSPLIMCKTKIDESASAAALGMGLENLNTLKEPLLTKIPLVLDANCFNTELILPFLQRKDVIITPHPKEFTRLWKMVFDENLSLETLQKNRFFHLKKMAQKLECVIVLKGANTLICQNDKLFVVNLGTAALAKGGSGDALSGMILALLCGGFEGLEAAKNAVLAHALVAKKYTKNINSFDALKLIKGLECL